MVDRKQAVDFEAAVSEAVEYLGIEIPRARQLMKLDAVQEIAFPRGLILDLNENGEIRSLGVVSDDGSHVPAMLERAQYDPQAFSAAKIRAGWELSTGVKLSEPLIQFAARELLGLLKKPKSEPGRKPEKIDAGYEGMSAKDQTLIIAIHRARELGFAPLRNEASDHTESGCDVVGHSMRRLGYNPNSYSRLSKIWKRRKPSIFPDDY